MVSISVDAKPIKNIKMADSNTPIGKVRFHLCFNLCPPPCSSVIWVATISHHISRSSGSGVVGFPHKQRFFVVNIEQV